MIRVVSCSVSNRLLVCEMYYNSLALDMLYPSIPLAVSHHDSEDRMNCYPRAPGPPGALSIASSQYLNSNAHTKSTADHLLLCQHNARGDREIRPPPPSSLTLPISSPAPVARRSRLAPTTPGACLRPRPRPPRARSPKPQYGSVWTPPGHGIRTPGIPISARDGARPRP